MSKWSGMAALGEMAKGAGQYFGSVSKHQRQTERLAQARAEKIADRDEGRQYAESIRDEGREFAADQRSDAQDLQQLDEMAAENTAHVEGVKARRDKLQADKASRDEWDRRREATQKDKMEALTGKSSDKSASEVTHETRTKQAQVAMREVRALTQGPDAYDPTSIRAGVDQVMVGGLTNFLATEKGQQYQSATKRAKEAFLRAATGAAAPESENKAYVNMFIPQFGDSKETMDAKFTAMDEQIRIMAEAYPEGTPQDVRNAGFQEVAAQMKEKYDLQDTSPEGVSQREKEKADAFITTRDSRGNYVKSQTQADKLPLEDIMNRYGPR